MGFSVPQRQGPDACFESYPPMKKPVRPTKVKKKRKAWDCANSSVSCVHGAARATANLIVKAKSPSCARRMSLICIAHPRVRQAAMVATYWPHCSEQAVSHLALHGRYDGMRTMQGRTLLPSRLLQRGDRKASDAKPGTCLGGMVASTLPRNDGQRTMDPKKRREQVGSRQPTRDRDGTHVWGAVKKKNFSKVGVQNCYVHGHTINYA